MTIKSLFFANLIFSHLVFSPLQAMQVGDKGHLSDSQQNQDTTLLELLSTMKSNRSLGEKKADVKELMKFSSADIKNLQPNEMPIKQFDNIFETILQSEISLSDEITSSLWKFYIKLLSFKYGRSVDKWPQDIIPLHAQLFYMKHIKTDLLTRNMTPNNIKFFIKLLAPKMFNRLKSNNDKDKHEVFSNLVYILSLQPTSSLADNEFKGYNEEFIFYLIHNFKDIKLNKTQQKLISQQILPKIDLDRIKIEELQKYLQENSKSKDSELHAILIDFFSIILKLNQTSPKVSILDIYNSYKIEKLHSMIFSDLPGMQFAPISSTPFTTPSNVVMKIIYNLDGYTKDKTGKTDISGLPQKSGIIHKGEPLIIKAGEFIKTLETPVGSKGYKVQKDIPIGYNIYLPAGIIKGVIVHVYGGFETTDRIEKLSRPSALLSSLDNYLMSQGIAVVKLSLINFLELEKFQLEMPELVHTKLHASINKFFESLRGNDSDKIFQDLIPNTAKIYLYGASFGGRTAIRQAELYPNTYDGYISHNGSLSSLMIFSSDLSQVGSNRVRLGTSEAYKWLNPSESNRIQNINEPILILHNFDDNNVNIKVSLDFYQQALKNGKGNLVKLFVTRKGNETPSEKQHNKGHFLPTEPDLLKQYAKTISSFILEGPTAISKETNRMSHETLSEWSAHQHTIYGNKNYRDAGFNDKFVSEAYRAYKNTYFRTGSQQQPQQSKRYDELLQQLQAQNSKNLEDVSEYPLPNRTSQNTEEEENLRFEDFWVQKALPLYHMLRYIKFYLSPQDIDLKKERVETEINYLVENNKLSNVAIENALNQEFPGLLEITNLSMSYTIFTKNSWVQDLYKYYLQKKYNPSNFKIALLVDFYKGNPELMNERITELLVDPTVSSILVIKDESDVKEKLRQRINEDKQFLLKRMKDMGSLNDFNRQRFGKVTYLLINMNINSSLETKKAHVVELSHFSSEQIEQVNPDNIPYTHFDSIFNNILESEVPISDNLAQSLWELYFNSIKKQKGFISSKWGILPKNIKSFYEKYMNTTVLTESMGMREQQYINKYLSTGVVTLLNNMNRDSSLEKKKADVEQLALFPPIRIEQIGQEDIKFDQFENIFDNILAAKVSLKDISLQHLWEIYMNAYIHENGRSSSLWKTIPYNAATLYKQHINTDTLKDCMSPEHFKAFDSIVTKGP